MHGVSTRRLENLPSILETEKNQRLLRGYHYNKKEIISPLITFFKQSEKEEILFSFDWYNQDSLENVYKYYNLDERFYYGFPISLEEYSNNIKKLVISLNNNFNNKIDIKK